MARPRLASTTGVEFRTTAFERRSAPRDRGSFLALDQYCPGYRSDRRLLDEADSGFARQPVSAVELPRLLSMPDTMANTTDSAKRKSPAR